MTLFFSKYRKYVDCKNPNLGRRWVVYEFMTVRGVMRFVGKVEAVHERPSKTPKTPISGDVRSGRVKKLASATRLARHYKSHTGYQKG